MITRAIRKLHSWFICFEFSSSFRTRKIKNKKITRAIIFELHSLSCDYIYKSYYFSSLLHSFHSRPWPVHCWSSLFHNHNVAYYVAMIIRFYSYLLLCSQVHGASKQSVVTVWSLYEVFIGLASHSTTCLRPILMDMFTLVLAKRTWISRLCCK